MSKAKPPRVRLAKEPPAADAGAMIAINHFFSRYLTRLYKAFDGDLIAAIVLAEIAHHSVSAFVKQAGGLGGVHNAIVEGRFDRDAYLPTNAFSIAQVTGIPRETVRRKVAVLVGRGWLKVTDDGGLVLTGVPYGHFRKFNDETIDEFMQTADVLFDVGGGRPPSR